MCYAGCARFLFSRTSARLVLVVVAADTVVASHGAGIAVGGSAIVFVVQSLTRAQ